MSTANTTCSILLDALIYRTRKQTLENDTDTLRRLGTSPAEIDDKLAKLMDAAAAAYRGGINPNPIVGSVEVMKHSFRDQAPVRCIYCEIKIPQPRIVTIRNIDTEEEVTLHEMSFHLLWVHHYFGTPQTAHRTDPAKLFRILST